MISETVPRARSLIAILVVRPFASGEATSLHALWFRRQSTKFNGVSYIIQ